MLLNKRQFLQSMTGLATLTHFNVEKALAFVSTQTPNEIAQNEDFWAEIRVTNALSQRFARLRL